MQGRARRGPGRRLLQAVAGAQSGLSGAEETQLLGTCCGYQPPARACWAPSPRVPVGHGRRPGASPPGPPGGLSEEGRGLRAPRGSGSASASDVRFGRVPATLLARTVLSRGQTPAVWPPTEAEPRPTSERPRLATQPAPQLHGTPASQHGWPLLTTNRGGHVGGRGERAPRTTCLPSPLRSPWAEEGRLWKQQARELFTPFPGFAGRPRTPPQALAFPTEAQKLLKPRVVRAQPRGPHVERGRLCGWDGTIWGLCSVV